MSLLCLLSVTLGKLNKVKTAPKLETSPGLDTGLSSLTRFKTDSCVSSMFNAMPSQRGKQPHFPCSAPPLPHYRLRALGAATKGIGRCHLLHLNGHRHCHLTPVGNHSPRVGRHQGSFWAVETRGLVHTGACAQVQFPLAFLQS